MWVMMIKNGICRFLKDETGQTTTEYILILAVVVTLIMQFRTKFKGIIENLLGSVEKSAQTASEME
jgi:Flp pilus assembly pilin Flp